MQKVQTIYSVLKYIYKSGDVKLQTQQALLSTLTSKGLLGMASSSAQYFIQ